MDKEQFKSYYPGLNKIAVIEEALPNNNDLFVIPDNKFKYGEIVAVGSIKDKGDIATDTFKVGDKIYFLAQSGFNMDLPEGTIRLLNIQEVVIGKRA